MVFAVGAGDELVGISHACDYPPELEGRKVVTRARFDPAEMSSAEIYNEKVEASRKFGGLYRLDETAMWGCSANVVLTQGPGDFTTVSLHGVRAIAEGLNPRPELLVLYPRHVDDVLDDHIRVGFSVGHMGEARALVDHMQIRIGTVEDRVRDVGRRLVGFLQWIDPGFSGGYWIPQLIEIAGGVDALNTAGLSPTRVHWQELRQRNPDILIVACEDMSIERIRSEMPLLTDRPGWSALSARRLDRVFLGDGACFTRPGPRLLDGLEALAWAIHPDCCPEPPPHVLQKFRD
jgi:iron complex transport system substrate-binding protein